MCYISYVTYLLMECDSLLFIVHYSIVLQCTFIAFKRGKLLWCRLISCEGACLWVLLLRCLLCRKFIVVLCWVDNCTADVPIRYVATKLIHNFTTMTFSVKYGVLRKLVGIKWYHHVQNDEVRWTTTQPHLSAVVQARRFSRSATLC